MSYTIPPWYLDGYLVATIGLFVMAAVVIVLAELAGPYDD